MSPTRYASLRDLEAVAFADAPERWMARSKMMTDRKFHKKRFVPRSSLFKVAGIALAGASPFVEGLVAKLW